MKAPLLKMIVQTLTFFVLVAHVSAQNVCPNCGSLEVPYPLSTSDNCGEPMYKVYCNDNILQFKSVGGFYYDILSTNPSAYRLIIAPPRIQKNTCFSSDFSLGGLKLDERLPFNVSTHNTVMLLNCSDNLLLSPLNCSSNSLCRQFEGKVEEASACRNTLCCTYLKDSAMTSHYIRLRPEGCSAYTAVVDLKQGDPIGAWNYGIELQWVPPN